MCIVLKIKTSLNENNIAVDFLFVQDMASGEHEIVEVRVTPELEESSKETTGLCGDYSGLNLIDHDQHEGFELYE